MCIWLNAGLLPHAVIIKLTRRRDGGIRGGVMEREILKSEDMKGFSFTLFPISNAYFQIGFCHEGRSKLVILVFQMVIIVANVGR